MRLRRALLLPCLAAFLPAAHPPATAEPPVLGEKAKPAQIDRWKRKYLDYGSFVEAATDATRVTMFDPFSVRTVNEGKVEARFRSELFRPAMSDGQRVRSVRKTLSIDCRQLRYRELAIEEFARSNLSGPLPSTPLADRWAGPFGKDSSVGRGLRLACDNLSGIEGSDGTF